MLPAQVSRLVARACLAQRAITTSAVSSGGAAPITQWTAPEDLTPEQKRIRYPKIGNRDIVCYQINDEPNYFDMRDFPCPAIRFKENTEEVLALRAKEKGDWKTLTLEEKKELYRNSFRLTYAEMDAPTGEWKHITAICIGAMAVTLLAMIYMRKVVYPPLPATINEEWKHKNLERMLTQGQGPIEGVSSLWDYEKHEWKK